MTPVRRAGVLGHPISHSLSPVLHRAAYAELGLPWQYDAFDVAEDGLVAFLGGLDATWVGLSLTMPLKVAAIRSMDYVEPFARSLGVINTVLVQPMGSGVQLVGANTDVYGVRAALLEAGVTHPDSAVVIGGGATAISSMAALAEMGCRTPLIAVRSRSRAGALMRAAAAIGVTPTFIDVAHAATAAATAAVVVSTVPCEAGEEIGDALRGVTPGTALLDVVYEPLLTPLRAAWEAHGGASVGGVRMLLHQAGEQVRLMTGRAAPIAAMDAALVSHLSV